MTATQNSARTVASPFVRRAVGVFLVVLLAAIVFDWQRPPAEQASAVAAVRAIEWYQENLSGKLTFIRCRFNVSCSEYAKRAFRDHGFVVGVTETFFRVTRCW